MQRMNLLYVKIIFCLIGNIYGIFSFSIGLIQYAVYLISIWIIYYRGVCCSTSLSNLIKGIRESVNDFD